MEYRIDTHWNELYSSDILDRFYSMLTGLSKSVLESHTPPFWPYYGASYGKEKPRIVFVGLAPLGNFGTGENISLFDMVCNLDLRGKYSNLGPDFTRAGLADYMGKSPMWRFIYCATKGLIEDSPEYPDWLKNRDQRDIRKIMDYVCFTNVFKIGKRSDDPDDAAGLDDDVKRLLLDWEDTCKPHSFLLSEIKSVEPPNIILFMYKCEGLKALIPKLNEIGTGSTKRYRRFEADFPRENRPLILNAHINRGWSTSEYAELYKYMYRNWPRHY